MAKMKKKPMPIKKPSPLKKIKFTKTNLFIGSAILIFFLLVAAILNITRIEYLIGKKDPIAVVNKEPIYMKLLKTDFIKSSLDYQNLMNKSLIDELTNDVPSRDSYQNDLLNSIIDNKVQTIKAKQLDIKLTSKELSQINIDYNTALANYHNALGDSFNTTLLRINLSEKDFNDEVKSELIDDHINGSLLKRELETYKFTIPKKDLLSVYARGIIMQLTTGKEAEIKKAAKDALAMLKSGVKFEEVAKKYSKYIYNAGGSKTPELLGWISRTDVPTDFGNKIFAVEPGHFTDVIENKSACSIILIDKKKTIDVNKLTTAEEQTLINSDNFKKYYTNVVKDWRKGFKVYKYITNFKIS
jgi:parvulin-like peptidyl-prolyl isomerase